MFKTKSAMFGLAAALAGTALLLAGMGMGSTAGAATDVPGAPSGFPESMGTEPGGGNPPASPIEPVPSAPTDGGTNPAGDAGAGTTAPGSLPDAGDGDQSANNSMVLFALAGVALAGAGVATVGAVRRK